MRERNYKFIYKLIFTFFMFFFPIVFIIFMLKMRFSLYRYILFVAFEFLIFGFSYLILEVRLLSHYRSFRKKFESKGVNFEIPNRYYKKIVSFDTLVSLEYFFNEEVDNIVIKIDEFKNRISALEKENYTKFNLKEYQLRSAIQELEKFNDRLKRKENIMDNIIEIIDNIDRNDVNYNMFFDELLYYFNKCFNVENIVIIREKEEGDFEVISKLSTKFDFDIELINQLKEEKERVIYKKEIVEKTGYEIILKIANGTKTHAFIFIGGHFGESLDFPILRKILDNFSLEISNIADKFFSIEKLKTDKKDLVTENQNLRNEVSQIQSDLEMQLMQMTDMYEEIVTLYEASKAIVKIYDIKEIEKIILEMMTEIIETEYGLVYYYDKHKDAVQISKFVHSGLSDEDDTKELRTWLKSLAIFEEIKYKKSEIILNGGKDKEIYGNEIFKIFNYAGAPIFQGKDIVGGVILFNKKNREDFSAGNLNLIAALTTQLGMSVQNIEFISKEIELKREEEQLKIASDIQGKLFPQVNPKLESFEIFGLNVPAKAVGGDYYDYIKINDDEVIGIIADVSGKGIPAALLVSMIRTMFRMLILNIGELSPKNILSNINNYIASEDLESNFVTAVCFVANSKNNSIVYSNAGHTPILLYQEATNDIIELTTDGTVLGVMEDELFEEAKFTFAKGDIAVFYTDGVIEAKLDEVTFFGFEQLQEIIIKNNKYPADYIVRKIYRELTKFFGTKPQNDDITILALKSF